MNLTRLTLAVALPAALCAQTAPKSSATTTTTDDEVVKMEKFEVTTTLERYHETSSSAATKVPTDVKDLASSVQVLNSAFLADIRSTRLEDAFNYITGLNKQGNNANAFTLRGFAAAGSNLQSIQVDGLPGPPSRFASPPTINVERFEVLKGPTSVMYGQGNPGGMLNIATKSPQARRRATVSTYFTSYASDVSSLGDAFSWQVSLDATGPLLKSGKLLYRLVASWEDQESFRDYYFQENLYLYPSLTYNFNADTFLTVKVDHVREERQANDGIAVPFLNAALLPPINVSYQAPNHLDTDYGDSTAVTFQTRLFDKWTVRAAYRTTWHTDSRRALETAQGAIVSNTTNFRLSTIRPRYRVQENERGYNFIDANTYGTFGGDKFQHTLIFGVNGGREWLRTNRLAFGPFTTPVNLYTSVPAVATVYPTTPTGLQDRQSNFWSYGLYASDQIKIGDKLNLTLGVRRETIDSYQKDATANRGSKPTSKATSPTLGVVYHVTPAFSLYGSYSKGFKPQVPGNVDANDNPHFDPELSEQKEAGIKADLLDGRLTGTLSLYDLRKKNVLVGTGTTSPTGNAIAILSGLQQSRGIELNAAYLPQPNWQIQLGYTYIDARVKSSPTANIVGALLDNTPHNAGSLWTRYNFTQDRLKGLGIGLGLVYTGQRQAIITNVPTARFQLPSYTRADLGIYYRRGRFDYALNAGNLFDRTYIAGAFPGGADRINPGEPRRVTFSIRYDLF